MLKNKKYLPKKKWIRYGLIPVVLFALWILLTYWYIVIFDQSFLVISYSNPIKTIVQSLHGRLFKGDKLTGEFKAVDNNLGIVAIRLQTYQRVQYKDEDLLRFRIKEKGASQWYYENNYRSGFVYDMPFLPFGFPIISTSQGKTYIFELESLKGDPTNSVSLSTRQPVLMTKYQANKSSLVKDPKNLIIFAFKKFVYSFATIDIIYSSFVFLIPLLFYLYWAAPMKVNIVDEGIFLLQIYLEKIGRKLLGDKYEKVLLIVKKFLMYGFFTILIVIILVDIIYLQILNDLIYFMIIGLWLILSKMFKYESKNSLFMGLGLLILASLSSLLSTANISQKATAWAFVFFVIGFVQSLFDIKYAK